MGHWRGQCKVCKNDPKWLLLKQNLPESWAIVVGETRLFSVFLRLKQNQ
jgi:hypothetical protein